MDIGVFPRSVGADGATPAVVPAIVGALAIEGVGLVVEDIDAHPPVPVTVTTRWRGKSW